MSTRALIAVALVTEAVTFTVPPAFALAGAEAVVEKLGAGTVVCCGGAVTGAGDPLAGGLVGESVAPGAVAVGAGETITPTGAGATAKLTAEGFAPSSVFQPCVYAERSTRYVPIAAPAGTDQVRE